MKQDFWFIRFGLTLLVGVVLGLSSGCSTAPRLGARVEPYRPTNVVTNETAMSRVVQRVVVLPLVFSGEFSERKMTRNLIESVLESELVKRGAFEPYFISPAALKSLTGEDQWRIGEKRTSSFFQTLEESYQCQAVLFAMVDHYHPYPPQTIAWKMKLVDTDSLQTIWEIDELFDGGDVTVARAAEDHYHIHQSGGTRHRDERSVFNSPRRFGQYTVAAALQTLPY